MIVGMDFGTTNSGLAVFDDHVKLIPIDSRNPSAPHVVRTTLYISRHYEHYIGRKAIDEYYERNQGRPIKLRKQHVGTIELNYASLGTFYRDVFVWVDELEPGRLFRSMKTYLADEDFLGTSVWGRFYTMEDLVSVFLFLSKIQAEKELGKEITEIVLGRPVHFATDPEADTLAEERLARAAILAGYERVHFALEPVAAAFHYQQSLTSSQRILVFDFGGGTLDITIMELDGSGKRRVLSTDGVRIAGDAFDKQIVMAKLARHFGAELTYGPKAFRMPRHIFLELCDWQTLHLLNRHDTLSYLGEVERSTANPGQIRALKSLIINNYGLQMFDQVEKTKIKLSVKEQDVIRFLAQDISIKEPLSRDEFERIIGSDASRISDCIDNALASAQVRPQQIDAVIRTGGSSLIPFFQHMLEKKFGVGKVKTVDEFASVTAGLAIAARLLSGGELELHSYSTEILDRGSVVAKAEQFDSPVSLLAEQLQEDRAFATYTSSQEYAALELESASFPKALVFISLNGYIKRSPLSLCLKHGQREPIIHGITLEEDDELAQLVAANLDETLILITDLVRFFTVGIDKLPLVALEGAGRHLHRYVPLLKGERITAVCTLNDFESYKYMNVITAHGFLFRIDSHDILTPSRGAGLFGLEGPDFPVAILPSNGVSDFFVVTMNGSAIRLPEEMIEHAGVVAIRPKPNGRVVGCLIVDDASTPTLVSPDGLASRRSMRTFPTSGKPRTQIRKAVTGMTVARVFSAKEGDELILGSAQGDLVRESVEGMPAADRPTKGKKIARVLPNDPIAHAVVIPQEAGTQLSRGGQ